mmetsp:Transcript_81337/g.263882  ORF Transcript_81337/g.263882 Transcript_81337/m.263882 type:complete len:212 (-) Transcript_81337:2882-3517(-)
MQQLPTDIGHLLHAVHLLDAELAQVQLAVSDDGLPPPLPHDLHTGRALVFVPQLERVHESHAVASTFGLRDGGLAPSPQVGAGLQQVVRDLALPPHEADLDRVDSLLGTPLEVDPIQHDPRPLDLGMQAVDDREAAPAPEDEGQEAFELNVLPVLHPKPHELEVLGQPLGPAGLQLAGQLAARDEQAPGAEAGRCRLGVHGSTPQNGNAIH